MGMWIAIGISIFVLGSIMALKPSGLDVRMDKLRMTARKLSLNPKLITCPAWIRGKNDEFGKGMMGQYGIIMDDVSLPHVRYKAINNQWRTENIDNSNKVDFSLDNTDIDLPKSIQPYIKGLEAKANAIQIYWDDHHYVRPASNPTYNEKDIEEELQQLKNELHKWANTINNTTKKQ